MINKSKTNERAEFLSGGYSADGIRRQFIETPTEAAQQPAINTGLELLAFMSALPEALLASEQRELKRLARTSDDKNDPRIARLKTSIEGLGELSRTASLGKTRIDRVVASLSEAGDVFHGFVSDSELHAREKLTVRISASRNGEKDDKSLLATTDANGYFSISLGDRKTGDYKPNPRESTVKLSEQMAERLASVNAKEKAKAADGTGGTQTTSDNGQEIVARVEILDASGKTLLQDSSPLVINAGTAYREYVIDGNEVVKPFEPVRPDKPDESKTAEEKTIDAKAASSTAKAAPAKASTAKKASTPKKKK